MKTLLEFLDGRKTYCAIGGIFVLTFCYWQGWVKLPDQVANSLTTAAIDAVPMIFLRMGISKVNKP